MGAVLREKLPRYFVALSPDTQIFRTRYPVTCKVYTGYHATCEIEHGSSACTVDNPLAKARGLTALSWHTAVF